MFAVIQTGAKQYKVKKGDTIEIEIFADKEVKEGQTINLDNVLLLNGSETHIGMPLVEGASVEAKVLAETKSDKIRVYKMKAKKRYQKTQGHRQNLLKVEIIDIKHGSAKSAPAPKAEKSEATEEAPKKTVKKAVKKEEA